MLAGAVVAPDLSATQRIVDEHPDVLVATIDGQMLGRGSQRRVRRAPTSSLCATRWSRRPRSWVSTEGCWRRAVDHVARVEAQAAQVRQQRDGCATRWPPSSAGSCRAERDVHVRQRAATTAHRLEQLLAEKDEVAAALAEHAADLQAARDRLQELGSPVPRPSTERSSTRCSPARKQARQAHHETGLNARSAHERHASLQAKHAELVEQAQQARGGRRSGSPATRPA